MLLICSLHPDREHRQGPDFWGGILEGVPALLSSPSYPLLSLSSVCSEVPSGQSEKAAVLPWVVAGQVPFDPLSVFSHYTTGSPWTGLGWWMGSLHHSEPLDRAGVMDGFPTAPLELSEPGLCKSWITRARKGHLSLQPLKAVVTFPFSLLSSEETGGKKAENYLFYPKLQSKEPQPLWQLAGRAIQPTGSPGPLTELLWLGRHGTGQGSAGRAPVCVYVCVCACVLGWLAASPAWEAQAGG